MSVAAFHNNSWDFYRAGLSAVMSGDTPGTGHRLPTSSQRRHQYSLHDLSSPFLSGAAPGFGSLESGSGFQRRQPDGTQPSARDSSQERNLEGDSQRPHHPDRPGATAQLSEDGRSFRQGRAAQPQQQQRRHQQQQQQQQLQQDHAERIRAKLDPHSIHNSTAVPSESPGGPSLTAPVEAGHRSIAEGETAPGEDGVIRHFSALSVTMASQPGAPQQLSSGGTRGATLLAHPSATPPTSESPPPPASAPALAAGPGNSPHRFCGPGSVSMPALGSTGYAQGMTQQQPGPAGAEHGDNMGMMSLPTLCHRASSFPPFVARSAIPSCGHAACKGMPLCGWRIASAQHSQGHHPAEDESMAPALHAALSAPQHPSSVAGRLGGQGQGQGQGQGEEEGQGQGHGLVHAATVGQMMGLGSGSRGVGGALEGMGRLSSSVPSGAYFSFGFGAGPGSPGLVGAGESMDSSSLSLSRASDASDDDEDASPEISSQLSTGLCEGEVTSASSSGLPTLPASFSAAVASAAASGQLPAALSPSISPSASPPGGSPSHTRPSTPQHSPIRRKAISISPRGTNNGLRRGLSSFFGGKSRSFTSLSDVSSIQDIQELAKPVRQHLRRKRIGGRGAGAGSLGGAQGSSKCGAALGIVGGRGKEHRGMAKKSLSSSLAVAVAMGLELDGNDMLGLQTSGNVMETVMEEAGEEPQHEDADCDNQSPQ